MSSAAPAAPVRIVTDWQVLDPDAAAAIGAFWQREGAIPDAAQAGQRLPQVVAHAVDAAGRIAAVCTAVAMTLPRLGQPMYYYRCFIGREWRTSRLVLSLLQHARAVLETHARASGFPCIGIVLELENVRFGGALRMPFWPNTGFTYIGRSKRGLDLRVCYFRGARLKPPAA